MKASTGNVERNVRLGEAGLALKRRPAVRSARLVVSGAVTVLMSVRQVEVEDGKRQARISALHEVCSVIFSAKMCRLLETFERSLARSSPSTPSLRLKRMRSGRCNRSRRDTIVAQVSTCLARQSGGMSYCSTALVTRTTRWPLRVSPRARSSCLQPSRVPIRFAFSKRPCFSSWRVSFSYFALDS
jgi:hypothetical protein